MTAKQGTDRIMYVYDDVVGLHGTDGIPTAAASVRVQHAVAEDPASYDIPSYEELVRVYTQSTITEARNGRARRRLQSFQTCADALTGGTILGPDDPILDVAMRVGASDGRDKSLRHFRIDDWESLRVASATNVADTFEADAQLRHTLDRIQGAYHNRETDTLESLLKAHNSSLTTTK